MNEIPYKDMFSIGDHLVLQLLCGDIFEGDYCAGGTYRIDLVNATQHNNPNKLGGVQSFYKQEIDKIHRLKAKLTEKPVVEKKQPEDEDRIKIVEEEYYRLREMAKDYIYIDKADKRYYEAVNKLIEAETIGVAALGMQCSQHATIKLLAICTWREVYLFDLIEHRKRYFYPELKEILESAYVCKVIHKGSHLVSVLYRNYKIYVQNTFDTQVVDLIIQKNETGKCPRKGRDLSECLIRYFNLPNSLISDALKSTQKSWCERPLSDKRKLYASKLVTYLVILKGEMQSILLSKTYKTIDDVHDLYYNLDPYDYAMTCQNNDISKDIRKMIPATDIPNLEKLSIKDDETNKEKDKPKQERGK